MPDGLGDIGVIAFLLLLTPNMHTQPQSPPQIWRGVFIKLFDNQIQKRVFNYFYIESNYMA